MDYRKICAVLVLIAALAGCAPPADETIFIEKDSEGIYRVFDVESGLISHETKDEGEALDLLIKERTVKKERKK